jgi:hypothetical protein
VRPRVTAALVGAIAWGAAQPAAAYRPFDQTDADVAELHVVELEVGPVDFQLSQGATAYEPLFVFNYGFWDGWEFVIDSQVGSDDTAKTLTQQWQAEVGLLVKHVLRKGSLQEGTGPSVATEIGLLLPPVPAQSGGGVGASVAVMVSQKWENLTVHVNVEGDYTRTHEPDGVFGFIAEGPERWPVRPVAEAYWEIQTGIRPTLSGLLGAIWQVNKQFSLDAAFRVASESQVPVQELRVGFTWSFSVASAAEPK